MKTNKAGFTLVEILVVVIIIGLLAAVATPKILDAQERTFRKIDATNAVEFSNILKRAFQTDAIQFPTAKNDQNNSSTSELSVAVIVSKDGLNYYRGSGAVLINGGDSTADNAESYRRVRQIFEESGFINVQTSSKKTNEGGWACYGVALLATGNTTIFSSTDNSECTSAATSGNYTKYSNIANNPIKAYLPAGVQ